MRLRVASRKVWAAAALLAMVVATLPGSAKVETSDGPIIPTKVWERPEMRVFYYHVLGSGTDMGGPDQYELDLLKPVLFGISWRDAYWLFEREAGRTSPGPPWLGAATDRPPPPLNQPIRVTLEILQGPPYSSRIRARSTVPDLDR